MSMRPAALALLAVLAGLLTTALPDDAEAARCTRVAVQGGGEVIVNTCNTCQRVNIRRKRRGIAMPVMRTFNVRGRATFPISFKGPGRSRITSEVPCNGEQGASQNIMDPKAQQAAKKCVALKKTQTGVALVNSCATCRGAAVERYTANGRSLGRQAYKLQPQSVVSVDPKGAAGVSFLADVACSS